MRMYQQVIKWVKRRTIKDRLRMQIKFKFSFRIWLKAKFILPIENKILNIFIYQMIQKDMEE